MKKPIDMLIAIKKPWVERVSELLGRQDQFILKLSTRELSKFWDSIAEAYLRSEHEATRAVLEEWLQKYFASEIDTRRLTKDIRPLLIPLLSICESVCIDVAHGQFSEAEQVLLYPEVVAHFNGLYDFAATVELGMYVYELRRREEAVRGEIERLDESRSSFINTAAHELKTPLTLIEGYSEMLSEIMENEQDSQDRAVLIRGIRTGTKKMRALIDELIDVSLVDNQMLSLYFEPVRMEEILKQVIASFDETISEKTLEVGLTDADAFKEKTFADRERLVQAFTHLIRNAVQYTPPDGSVRIDGRLLPGFIEISLKDTGIGIAREDQTLIFDKFGHVPVSTTHHDVSDRDPESGAGLGLHLTRGILEAHGGTIWVESPGRDEDKCPGSTFHVMLPIRAEKPGAHAIQSYVHKRTEGFE